MRLTLSSSVIVCAAAILGAGCPGPQRPRPRPRAPAKVDPRVPLADLPALMRGDRYKIRRCFQRAMMKNAALAARGRRTLLTFVVQPAGRVEKIRLAPPVGFGFGACLRAILKAWQFLPFRAPPQRFRQWLRLRAI